MTLNQCTMKSGKTPNTGIKTIAIVANCTWNIFQFRLNVIDRLLREGCEVVVIAPIDEYIVYREQYPEVRHIGLRVFRRSGMNPFMDFILFLELLRKYRKIRPDVILHYTAKPNIYGGMAAYFLGIPSLAVVTGLGYAFINKGIVNNITKILYRLSSRFHRKFIFENADDKSLFIEQKLVEADQAIAIKGCGVDLEYYQPIKNHFPKKVIFTFIGRILYDKGIGEFIAAARLIKEKYGDEVSFWVAGELDRVNPSRIDRDEFNHWIDEGVIEYHGFSHNIKNILNKSSCIVLPSYREGMPRTILEAMAMARPVITTRTAGCRETVEDGISGFLVELKSPSALEEAMEKFIALTGEQRQNMGKAGRIKAEKEFDDEVIASQISQIIQNTITQGKQKTKKSNPHSIHHS